MNTPLKISFFETKEWEKEYLSSKISAHDLNFCTETVTENSIKGLEDSDVLCVFINSKLDQNILSKFNNLKLIATRSTGFDHIDTNYCKEKNILVTNVPTYGENTVAEHAMALLLSLTRRIIESVNKVRSGSFSPEGLTGIDLKGKIIGVIGTGHIGKRFIKMSNGFEMKVIAYDAYPDQDFASKNNFEYVNLDFLISNSDFISLHAPLNEQTKYIINRERISKMKDKVIIINTARGGLVETDALFDGLKSGKIGAAGLDALEEEVFLKEELELLHKDTEANSNLKTVLENHAMSHLDNVVVTPHNAFNSKEALTRILDTTAENIKCFIDGACKNLVGLK